MARAIQHQGEPDCAIALIGDGGMTAGMAFEALNHAGDLRQQQPRGGAERQRDVDLAQRRRALVVPLAQALGADGAAHEGLGEGVPHLAARRHAALGAEGRGVAEGLLLAGPALRGARLPLRRADPGPPHGRAARDLRERARDAARRATARSWSTRSPPRATATSRPSRTRSSTTASGSSTSSPASSRRASRAIPSTRSCSRTR